METNQKLVYLAEDDMLMVRMYERLFRLSGFELEMALNGEEAVSKLQTLKQKPAIILLDIMMPKLDGFEVLKFLKENAQFKDVPVVVLTNLAGKDAAARALEMGAALYLIKSEYQPKEVVEKIKEVIASHAPGPAAP